MGGAYCNHNVMIIFYFAGSLRITSNNLSKAMAIHQTLSEAKQQQLPCVVIDSNSKILIDHFKQQASSNFQQWQLNECRKDINGSTFSFVASPWLAGDI